MLNIKKYILKKWFLILAIHFSFTQPVWGVPIIEKIPEATLPIAKAAFKSKYYDTLSPIIFRKAASTWKAAKWDFDFFADQYGDTAVSVQLNETLTGEAEGPVKTTYTSTTLKKYIEHVKAHGIKAGYLNQWNILIFILNCIRFLKFLHSMHPKCLALPIYGWDLREQNPNYITIQIIIFLRRYMEGNWSL